MAGYKRVILCLWARPFAPSKKVILDLVISRENTGILGLGLRNCQSRAGDVEVSADVLAPCSWPNAPPVLTTPENQEDNA